ncbi:MAG: hypothetical protein FWC19_05150 [Treponema sp.]|nr:hypothetical protein [Treponema sp.]MCL2272174.1 hypothetical protein [Treponema sp.]
MQDPGLLQALDYILNHSDESSIDVLAEAIVRRRRNVSIFGAVSEIHDPEKLAKEMSQRVNEGIGLGIEGMRNSVREMIIKILKEHAPELNEDQVSQLCDEWLPDKNKKQALPADVLVSMIDQFISFSQGSMNKSADEELRAEMGAWPQRYWNSFPQVIRRLISDYLKDKITEKDFKTRIGIALGK